jgi:hypothetical protein
MHQKFSCPTDICNKLLCCMGDEPDFHCPCEPSQPFFGYKPTCWGVWPASGEAWRDAYCGPPAAGCVVPEPALMEPANVNGDSAGGGSTENLPPLVMPESSLPWPEESSTVKPGRP